VTVVSSLGRSWLVAASSGWLPSDRDKREVEDCLARLPGIGEAAVIGVPDGAAGEAVKAFIVPLDKALTAEEVKAHCKQHLAAYKCPKLVEFRTELPKSNVGKILRKDLKAAELALASQSKGA
jgi:long-chain acyl-CoA synthetase